MSSAIIARPRFFVERLKNEPVLLRANVIPLFLMTQPVEAIKAKVREAPGRGTPASALPDGHGHPAL